VKRRWKLRDHNATVFFEALAKKNATILNKKNQLVLTFFVGAANIQFLVM
jgi:hypothetical protein